MAAKRRTAAQAAELLANLGIESSEGSERDDSGASAVWATVYFDGDVMEVADDYVELVGQCAERFKASRAGTLIVSGHAAGVDEPEQELLLSHARTRAVATLLEALGVLSHQILCVSRGANEPLVDPSDSARRWINRRVEIREGALVPRPPAWAQQRRKKKAAVAKAAAAETTAPRVSATKAATTGAATTKAATTKAATTRAAAPKAATTRAATTRSARKP